MLRNGSEKSRGEARVHMSFCNKGPGSQNNKRILFKKTRRLKLMNLGLSYLWEDAKSGLTEMLCLICILALWGQGLVFFSSWVSSGCAAERGCSILFPSWVPLGLSVRAALMWWAWWLQYPLFSDTTGNCLVHNPNETLETFTFFPNIFHILSNQLNN